MIDKLLSLLQIVAAPEAGTDVFPPSPVRNFRSSKDGSDAGLVTITFNAPGDDYDVGTGKELSQLHHLQAYFILCRLYF